MLYISKKRELLSPFILFINILPTYIILYRILMYCHDLFLKNVFIYVKDNIPLVKNNDIILHYTYLN